MKWSLQLVLSADDIAVVKEQAYAGYPSSMPDKVCKIKPYTMGQYLEMGTREYNTRLGLLLMTKDDVTKFTKDKKLPFNDLDVLSFLLQSAAANDNFLLEVERAFATFVTEDILLLPKINAVLIGSMEDKRLITPENFEDFQTILRLQNRKEISEPPPENESEGARKMRLLREQRDAVKKKQQQKDGKKQDLIDLLEIAEVFGIDYKDKTIYAFYGLIQRHQRREKWNQDIQMLCAGADSKKIKPQYWGENPDDK